LEKVRIGTFYLAKAFIFQNRRGTLKEQEIVELLKKESDEFRKLSEEHRSLDTVLAEIDSKRYLTPEEEVERKKIQKQKLMKKDRMAAIVRDFKKNHSLN
jgi:uncharacterized protein YdcH (DUF465 family)